MTDITPAPHIADVLFENTVYVATLPDGPIVALDGAGAAIWLALRENGDRTTLTARVAATITDPPDDLDAHVENFLTDLRTAGLLDTP